MAVYTTLSELQVNALLSRFDLPSLHRFTGAGDGVENTTYFLVLSDGRELVLTLFERQTSAELKPYLDLLDFYASRGLPVPAPLRDRSGSALQELERRPAVLVNRAPGRHCQSPHPGHCRLVGAALAQLHSEGAGFSRFIANPCGLDWADSALARLLPKVSAEDQQLIRSQLASARELGRLNLPRGIIHGDLFRDNVLFDGDRITAIIDFYNAGHDLLLLDLAIAVNDWAFTPAGEFQPALCQDLCDAYESLRPLVDAERSAWHRCLCWAATRFWISRLVARYLTPPGLPTDHGKDPLEYRSRLLYHLGNAGK